MNAMFDILTGKNVLFAISILLIFIVILVLDKKIKNNRKWVRIICFIPIVLSIIHFLIFNLHNANMYLFIIFLYTYILSFIVGIFGFLINKKKIIKNIFSIVLIILLILNIIHVIFISCTFSNIHNLTYQSYTESFKNALKILEKEYANSEHKKIDYDYLYEKYYPNIELAEKTNDKLLYNKTIAEFGNEFKDAHAGTSLVPPKNITEEWYDENLSFFDELYNRNYGFTTIKLSDGTIIASYVNPESEAYLKGLRDGMTITKKDGVDINLVLTNLSDFVYPLSAVLETETFYKSFYLFANGNDQTDVSYIDENGIEQTITVSDIGEPLDDSLLGKIQDVTNYYEDIKNLDTKIVGENIGYIYIKNEAYDSKKAILAYVTGNVNYLKKTITSKLNELKKQGMEKLVIDLRNNGGGYYSEANAITELFTDKTFTYSKMSKYKSNRADYQKVKGTGEFKNLEVVVLINSECASAGDILVDLLKRCENVTVIGFTASNNIAAATGGYIYLTNGDSVILYPIWNTLDLDGNILIDTDDTRKANVEPDIYVPLTKESVKELYNDSDYLLNYAIELLNN